MLYEFIRATILMVVLPPLVGELKINVLAHTQQVSFLPHFAASCFSPNF
jgi:hypothetical protein